MPQSDRFPRIQPQFSFLTLTKHKLALSVLVWSVICALVCNGKQRIFWTASAVTGVASYALVLLSPGHTPPPRFGTC